MARPASGILSFTGKLENDVTWIGPITVDLHVSTAGADSNWIVKAIDVYPDDYTRRGQI